MVRASRCVVPLRPAISQPHSPPRLPHHSTPPRPPRFTAIWPCLNKPRFPATPPSPPTNIPSSKTCSRLSATPCGSFCCYCCLPQAPKTGLATYPRTRRWKSNYSLPLAAMTPPSGWILVPPGRSVANEASQYGCTGRVYPVHSGYDPTTLRILITSLGTLTLLWQCYAHPLVVVPPAGKGSRWGAGNCLPHWVTGVRALQRQPGGKDLSGNARCLRRDRACVSHQFFYVSKEGLLTHM